MLIITVAFYIIGGIKLSKVEERRKYPRLDCGFSIHCREHEHPASNDVSQVKNISLGGAYFTTSRPFEAGREVALRINLPPTHNLILPLARVVESRECAKDHAYDTRVEFSHIEDNDRLALSTVLNDYFEAKGKYR